MAHAGRVGDDHAFAVRLHLPRAVDDSRYERDVTDDDSLERRDVGFDHGGPAGQTHRVERLDRGGQQLLRPRLVAARAPPQQREPEIGPRDREHRTVAESPVGLDGALEMADGVVDPACGARRQSERALGGSEAHDRERRHRRQRRERQHQVVDDSGGLGFFEPRRGLDDREHRQQPRARRRDRVQSLLEQLVELPPGLLGVRRARIGCEGGNRGRVGPIERDDRRRGGHLARHRQDLRRFGPAASASPAAARRSTRAHRHRRLPCRGSHTASLPLPPPPAGRHASAASRRSSATT